MGFIDTYSDFEEIHKEMFKSYKNKVQNLNIIRNVYGVAGAGKTTKMIKDFSADNIPVTEKYIIAFNRKIREEIITRTNLSKKFVKTFDALFKKTPLLENKEYLLLFHKNNISLPKDVFASMSPYYSLYLKTIKGLDSDNIEMFRGLIEGLLAKYQSKKVLPFELFPYYIFYNDIDVFEGKELVYIDEVQDINPSYFSIFSTEVKYYLAGAGDQTLYFLFGANKEDYKGLLGISKEKEVLTLSHRVPKLLAEIVNKNHLSLFNFETNSQEKGFFRYISLDQMIRLVKEYQNKDFSIGLLFRFKESIKSFIRELRWRGYYIFPSDIEFGEIYSIVSSRGENIQESLLKKYFDYPSIKNNFYEDGRGLQLKSTLEEYFKRGKTYRFFGILNKSVIDEYSMLLKEALKIYENIRKKNLEVLSVKLFNTIHATKGAEADIIFLKYDKERVNNMIQSGKISKDEEINVLYVALTRAKKGVYYVK